MQEIARLDKSKTGVSKAVQAIFIKRIIQQVGYWKNLYRKVGGYKNPEPEMAMPWLSSQTKAYLRGWSSLV